MEIAVCWRHARPRLMSGTRCFGMTPHGEIAIPMFGTYWELCSAVKRAWLRPGAAQAGPSVVKRGQAWCFALDSVGCCFVNAAHGDCDLPMRRQPKHRVRSCALCLRAKDASCRRSSPVPVSVCCMRPHAGGAARICRVLWRCRAPQCPQPANLTMGTRAYLFGCNVFGGTPRESQFGGVSVRRSRRSPNHVSTTRHLSAGPPGSPSRP